MLLFFILLAIIFKSYNEGGDSDGWEYGKFKIIMSYCCFLGWGLGIVLLGFFIVTKIGL